MAFPALIKLNGQSVTDQGRTFNMDRDERAVNVELASGIDKKYKKKIKKGFSIDWTFLPEQASETIDGLNARNYIEGIASTSTLITITVVRDTGTSTTYNAFIESYSEEVIRRDPTSNQIFYNVRLTLKEQ